MPELPEVETICRRLSGESGATLIGKRILDAQIGWRRTIAEPSAREFRRRIRGQVVRRIGRRGKYLLVELTRDTVAFHLRMSGSLILERSSGPLVKHARLVLRLGEGWRLVFRDPRKFGRVWLTADPAVLLQHLGPEPLDPHLDAARFYALIVERRRQMKPLLLDQSVLAGLGNIYVDETLHRAGIHPRRRSDTLSLAETHALWLAMRQVLRAAIKSSGTTFDAVYAGGRYAQRLRVYGRAGRPCRRCGTAIARSVIGQRSTHYCPRCQPARVRGRDGRTPSHEKGD